VDQAAYLGEREKNLRTLLQSPCTTIAAADWWDGTRRRSSSTASCSARFAPAANSSSTASGSGMSGLDVAPTTAFRYTSA
jgi:hypothetical protein